MSFVFHLVIITYCFSTDIQAFGLVITNDFTEFTLDVDNIVTYNVTIKNVGGTDIAAGSSDLYDILITVSDNADPTASGAETIDVTPLLTSATNLDAGITAGETIVVENVHTMINIPTADCSTYMYDTAGYICVQISKASGASFTDDSTTNNYYCLSFGDVVDGYTGTLECSGEKKTQSLKSLRGGDGGNKLRKSMIMMSVKTTKMVSHKNV